MSKTPKLRFKEFSEEWESFLLGDSIILYDNQRKPIKEQERSSGEYAYYGATGIIDYIDNYIFEGEYLLLGEDGANIITRNAPLIYKTQGRFWVNNHAHIFKPISKFNMDFMKHNLELINYIPYNTGTAQPKLNTDSLKSILFNSPSLQEQEKIASLLSLIDDKINLQSEKVKYLKDYKKGLMQKIFSRELRFKDENGNDYPEWEEKRVYELGDIITGNTPSKDNLDYYDISNNEKFIWITPTDITENKNIYEGAKSLSKKGYEMTRKLPPNTVLVTCIASIGKNAILKVSGSCNQQINAIIVNSENNYEFVYYLIEHNAELLKRFAGITATPILNKTDFSNLEFLVPKIEEQEKISNILSKIDLKIEKEQEKLDSLTEYKKGLLQQMFI